MAIKIVYETMPMFSCVDCTEQGVGWNPGFGWHCVKCGNILYTRKLGEPWERLYRSPTSSVMYEDIP